MFSLDAAGNGKLNLSARCTETFDCLCVTCLQMSTVLLNDCQSEGRGEKKCIWLIRSSWKVSWVHMLPGIQAEALKGVCVCVCVFPGLQRCRCCHAASSGYVISHTGSRQAPLICIEELTNELWHWSSFSWETEVETDGVKEKVREIERCVFLSFLQTTSVVSLMRRVAG